jgi:hypothetical protein
MIEAVTMITPPPLPPPRRLTLLTAAAPLTRPIGIAAAPRRPGSAAVRGGWAVILVGLLIAAIPALGFIMWIIGIAFCLAAFALAIIGIAAGQTIRGGILLVASLTVAPLGMLAAPLITTMLIGAE